MSHEHLTKPVPQWIWDQYEKLSSKQNYRSLVVLEAMIQEQCSESGVSSEVAELLRLLGLNQPPAPSQSEIYHDSLYSKTVQSIFDYEIHATSGSYEWDPSPRTQRRQPGDPMVAKPEFFHLSKTMCQIDGGIATVGSEVWNDDEKLVVDRLGRFSPNDVDFHSLIGPHPLAAIKDPELIFGDVIFLAYPFANQWGHFWEQIVARLLWIEQLGTEFSEPTHLLLPQNLPTAATELITSLALPHLKILFRRPGHSLKCDRLFIVPSRGTDFPAISHGSTLSHFRSPISTLDALQIRRRIRRGSERISPTRRVYFARRTATQRKSELFEHILWMYLEARGFEHIDLGEMPLQAQKEVIENTRYGIGLQGSYLYSLLAFASEESQFLTLMSSRSQDFDSTVRALQSAGLRIDTISIADDINLPFYSPVYAHSPLHPTSECLTSLKKWIDKHLFEPLRVSEVSKNSKTRAD